jgi:hypothetical protein
MDGMDIDGSRHFYGMKDGISTTNASNDFGEGKVSKYHSVS